MIALYLGRLGYLVAIEHKELVKEPALVVELALTKETTIVKEPAPDVCFHAVVSAGARYWRLPISLAKFPDFCLVFKKNSGYFLHICSVRHSCPSWVKVLIISQ